MGLLLKGDDLTVYFLREAIEGSSKNLIYIYVHLMSHQR